ncbi:hypothetical protein B0J13DRAFT_638048 [Dactylonectria estremocensis]|uniref:C2H2-type domain-containing protein n=1 Tax=Dactylonectria estremocensis TaxID=1079267 RepID=A0A9P9J375_9HYPO|nr:hypothetical protein B0J13DRAFT_638048 [Dactylonectria estremocensis]
MATSNSERPAGTLSRMSHAMSIGSIVDLPSTSSAPEGIEGSQPFRTSTPPAPCLSIMSIQHILVPSTPPASDGIQTSKAITATSNIHSFSIPPVEAPPPAPDGIQTSQRLQTPVPAKLGDTLNKALGTQLPPFRCSCGKRYFNLRRLRPHLAKWEQHKRIDQDDRPYKCALCNHGFGLKESLQKHCVNPYNQAEESTKADNSPLIFISQLSSREIPLSHPICPSTSMAGEVITMNVSSPKPSTIQTSPPTSTIATDDLEHIPQGETDPPTAKCTTAAHNYDDGNEADSEHDLQDDYDDWVERASLPRPAYGSGDDGSDGSYDDSSGGSGGSDDPYDGSDDPLGMRPI